jgi:AraC-like DNA-binding protein
MDFNKLVEKLAEVSFYIRDVHYFSKEPGSFVQGIHTGTYAFIFPIKGSARFTFDGVDYDLSPGKVVHCGPDMILDKRVIGNENWCYFEVYYNIINPKPEQLEVINNHYELEIGENPRIDELLRIMNKLYKTPGNIPAFKVKELFYSILYEIIISHRNTSLGESRLLVEEAIEYIHGNYMHNLTLEDLSIRYGMKVDNFSYIFHKYTGVRPINYLIIHRMKIAEELLLTRDYSVRKVAESVGYSDPYYFSRLFKKHKQIAPSEMKNRFQNNPL